MNDPKAIDELLADLPDLLTTDEVAELMRVVPGSVTRWIRDFGLKSISVGPRIRRIRKADFRSFLLTSDELGESPVATEE